MLIIYSGHVFTGLHTQPWAEAVGIQNDRIVAAVERTANGLAQAAGLDKALWPMIRTPESPYPPLFNDPALTGTLTAVFTDLLGKDHVKETPPATGSEDFGYFGLTDPSIPMLMYHLGSTDAARLTRSLKGEIRVAPLHDSGFYPDIEKCLPTGVVTLAAAVLALLSPGRDSGIN